MNRRSFLFAPLALVAGDNIVEKYSFPTVSDNTVAYKGYTIPPTTYVAAGNVMHSTITIHVDGGADGWWDLAINPSDVVE